MTTSWITEATARWDRVGQYDASPMPEVSTRELAVRLGRDVAECRLWNANWRNRIYRVTFGDGREAVAKQACVADHGELEQEFHSLRALAHLPLGDAIRIPAPIAYVSELHTYLAEFASGVSLDVLVRRGPARHLLDASRLAGHALGTIHGHWTREIHEIPVDDLRADFAQLTLHLARREKSTITSALEILRDHVVPVGQPFLDYKPANILYDRGRVGIVDPPEQSYENAILLWDVAVFRRGLYQELYRSVMQGSRIDLVREAMLQFDRAYLQACPLTLSAVLFRLLVDVLELQRLGQLIALQRGKGRRAQLRHAGRWFSPSRCFETTRHFAPLLLLSFQAHQAIKRLNRSVKSQG